MTAARGWVCPKCGSVYAPWVAQCARCSMRPVVSDWREALPYETEIELARKVEDQRQHLAKLQRKYEIVKGQMRVQQAALDRAEKALRMADSEEGLDAETLREALAVLAGRDPARCGCGHHHLRDRGGADGGCDTCDCAEWHFAGRDEQEDA